MKFIKRIINNKIIRNSLILINGTIISQIINVIISPILSRLYSPNEFGDYTSLTSWVMIITIIASMKYELAIMNKKDDNAKAKETFYVAMSFNVSINLFILLIAIISYVFKITILGLKYYEIILISILTFFYTTNTIVNMWFNRNEMYKKITNNRIIYSTVYALLAILNGFFNLKYLGLVLATIIAYISQFIYSSYILKKEEEFTKYKFDKVSYLTQIRANKNLPLFQMPALLLNTASTQLPVVLFKNFYNSNVSGWYSMSVKVISLPFSMVGTAIGEVYFKEASEIYSKQGIDELKNFTYKLFKKLLILGIIPMAIIMGYGDIIFSIVLGNEWKTSGVYSMLLAPWYYMVFVTSPLTYLYLILRKTKKQFFLKFDYAFFKSYNNYCRQCCFKYAFNLYNSNFCTNRFYNMDICKCLYIKFNKNNI